MARHTHQVASSLVRLDEMPHQTWARNSDEDWAGIQSRETRRRLQNRLNQRACEYDLSYGSVPALLSRVQIVRGEASASHATLHMIT